MSVIIASFTAMSLSCYVFYKYYSIQMINRFREDAIHLNNAMEDVLELAMRKKDVEEMERLYKVWKRDTI